MKVSVEILSKLGRRLTVVVPAAKVEAAIQPRLQNLMRTVRIDGFRPGKVPAKVIEQKYGSAVRGEAIEELLQITLKEALTQEKLFPATTPTVQSLKAEPHHPLEYSVTFDAYPEVQIANMAGVILEKVEVPIQENDIDSVLEEVRKQHVQWVETKEPVQAGNRVTIDLVELVDDKPVAKTMQKAKALVLTPPTLEAGFAALLGSHVNDELNIEIQFKGAPQTGRAGEKKLYQVQLHKIEEPKLPALDDAFAGTLGVKEGGAAKLREEIREHMGREVERGLKQRLKEQMLNKLVELHPLDLPQAAIEAERQRLQQEVLKDIERQTSQKYSIDQLPEAEQARLLAMAQRRVTLGLLFPVIIKEQNIKLENAKLDAHVAQMVSMFEDPSAALQMIRSNKELLANIRAEVLENEVIDYLLTQVQYQVKQIPYADFMKHAGHIEHAHHDEHHVHEEHHVHGPNCNHD